MKSLVEIESRSSEVQELLGSVPSWITRYGVILLFVLLSLLVTGSWFFKYPDIIVAPVTVTSINKEGKNILTGKVKLTMNKVLQVRAGQKVNLKFNSFPYMEYGLVNGEISRISAVPTDD